MIELLVVVTIIGLLAAILVPAITGALKSAKRSRAMTQVRDLDAAIKRYFSEYGKMPVPTGMGGADVLLDQNNAAGQARVIEILVGFNTNQNPRQVVFLDLDPSAFGVKHLRTHATESNVQDMLKGDVPYKDPWGNAYGILLDLNFDDKITAMGSFPEMRVKAAVFSVGEKANLTEPPYKTW